MLTGSSSILCHSTPTVSADNVTADAKCLRLHLCVRKHPHYFHLIDLSSRIKSIRTEFAKASLSLQRHIISSFRFYASNYKFSALVLLHLITFHTNCIERKIMAATMVLYFVHKTVLALPLFTFPSIQ